MTQQQIVDAVNRLTVGYSLDWFDIQDDADKAIYKINSYVCANFPLMSDILVSPAHTYSIKDNKNRTVPIFSDLYIKTIVIPFIAMEVLARDEEFTTVYNKYMQEVEDGLFTMFQREYNRIPPMFAYDSKDIGVFFEKDTAQKKFGEITVSDYSNDSYTNTDFEYSVTYVNTQDDMILTVTPSVDPNMYAYGTEFTVKGFSDSTEKSFISQDGWILYTFDGWYDNPNYIGEKYVEGDSINITSNIVLYTKWTSKPVYTIEPNGTLSIVLSDTEAKYVRNLVIPRFVTSIKGSTLSSCTNLVSIYIPDTVKSIESNSFANLPNLENITLHEDAEVEFKFKSLWFYQDAPISKIIIPRYSKIVTNNPDYSTSTADIKIIGFGINGTCTKGFDLLLRNLRSNIINADAIVSKVDTNVKVTFNYNGE